MDRLYHLVLKCRKKKFAEFEVSDVEENIYKDNNEITEELENFFENLEPY